jgi:hypothetical protein
MPDGAPAVPAPAGPNAAIPNAAPAADAFDLAGGRGAALAQGSAAVPPAFFGDLLGVSSARFLPNAAGGGSVVRTPSAARSSGWAIADGESPRPTDRIYYNFNWYSDVNRMANGDAGGTSFNVFRHVIGVEKTFFNERASVGLRLPFVDVEGPAFLSQREFADMSIVTKFAFVSEPTRVLSGGLVITVPTGQGFVIDLPNARGVIDGRLQDVLHPVILQPYVGYVRNLSERIYFQSFSSIAVPTDSRDVVWMTNSAALGFFLYRNPCDRFVQAVVPTVEVHEDTPLTDRGYRKVPIGASDQFNLTAGASFVLPRSTLGVALGVPLVAPRPYDIELIANYTLRF